MGTHPRIVASLLIGLLSGAQLSRAGNFDNVWQVVPSIGLLTPAHAIDRADIGIGPYLSFPNPLGLFGQIRIPVKEKLDIGIKAGAGLNGGGFLAQGDIKIPIRHDEPDLSIIAVFDNSINGKAWSALASGGISIGHGFDVEDATIAPYGAVTIGLAWQTSLSAAFGGFGAIGCEFRVTKTVAPIIEVMLPFGKFASPVFMTGGVMFYF